MKAKNNNIQNSTITNITIAENIREAKLCQLIELLKNPTRSID